VAGAALANGGAIKQAASGWLGGAIGTPTPTATSRATVPPTLPAATPAPAASLAVIATTAATRAPAPTAAPSATAQPATATPPPTDTATALPTASPLPSASPTGLPPDVVKVATVVLPKGLVGRLRDAPNGQVIGGVPGNILVYVLAGRQTTADGIVWVRLRLPQTGQSGWFAESLLQYPATAVP
jgi:hypothetical protein